MVNIAYTEEYKKNQKSNMKFFISENIKKSEKIYIDNLPDNYLIEKITYKTMKNCWDFIELKITDKSLQNTVSIFRNYYNIDLVYAKQNGQEYLITSEDYQGFAIINLSKMEKKIYIPESYKTGTGWCPIEFNWDEDFNKLICIGCIWGCPYSQRTYNNINLEAPNFDIFDENWEFE